MSTEPSEGETPTTPAVTANTQADITEQATTPTPTTHVKNPNPNPKRVAAGKRTAEKTRIAREQQKATAESYMEMQNNKAKATATAPDPAPTTEVESPKNSGLSINQWIAVAGLAVSLAGIYYKHEELEAAFSKKKPPEPTPASVELEPARESKRKGLRKMD